MTGPSGKAIAVIRPEYVRKADEMSGIVSHSAIVEAREYLGAITRLQIRLGGEKLLMDARFPVGQKPNPGDELSVAIDPARIRFVPTKT
ncbi:ABC-type Fe3+/spermidine/putrescine transport system ATPase subunit [Bradyrhizobium sp. USDA 4503]